MTNVFYIGREKYCIYDVKNSDKYKVKKIKNIEIEDLQEIDSRLCFVLFGEEPTETNSCLGTID